MRSGGLLGTAGAWRGVVGPRRCVVAAQAMVTSAVVAVRVDTGVESVRNVGVMGTSIGAARGNVPRSTCGHAACRAVWPGISGDAGIGHVGHIRAVRAYVGRARGARVARVARVARMARVARVARGARGARGARVARVARVAVCGTGSTGGCAGSSPGSGPVIYQPG